MKNSLSSPKVKMISYKGKDYKTIKINTVLLSQMDRAIKDSLAFEKLSGKQLNITSTVGEVLACKKFNLDWVLDDINTGFDAFDKDGKTVQIKTRRHKGVMSAQTGNLLNSKNEVAFDYALLLLLKEDYSLLEIYKLEARKIHEYLNPLNKKRAREKKKPRKAISVSTFKRLSL